MRLVADPKPSCSFAGANLNTDPVGHILAIANTVYNCLQANNLSSEVPTFIDDLTQAYVVGGSTLSDQVLNDIKTISLSYVTATIPPT